MSGKPDAPTSPTHPNPKQPTNPHLQIQPLTLLQKKSCAAKILVPLTDRNRNLFLPVRLVQPSPVEMEHVSTSPDIAKTVNLREPVKLASHGC